MAKTAAFVPVQQKRGNAGIQSERYLLVSVQYRLSGKISDTLNVADCLPADEHELKRGFVKVFSQEDARFRNSLWNQAIVCQSK